MIRLLLVALVGVPATMWYATRVIWAAYRGGPDVDCVCRMVPRRWSRLLLRVAGVDVVLENEHVIDPDRPQILVANHVSWFDVPALAGFVPGHYLFVAKKEVESAPFLGAAARACGHIYVDRQDRAKAIESLEAARQRLEESGATIIMFPEGTRSETGALQPFKKGAFVLAIQTGVEVVPAAISGSRAVMRKHSFWIRSGTIRVRFGEPIPVESLGLDQRGELTERAWSALAELQASGTVETT